MVLGPLDRRVIRTRCQACARRRIKCEGGTPCVYCTKKSISCVSQVPKPPAGVVFLNTTSSSSSSASSSQSPPSTAVSKICSKVPRDASNTLTAYFFSEFIVKNDFAGASLDVDGIAAAFQKSPSLFHASVAVAALDMSRNAFSSSAERRAATVEALKAYRNSIGNFRVEMQDSQLVKNDAALWTTFFLGIFELMYDVSGAGWVKHILYGTSQILQLRGPSAHLSGRGRAFFLTVRPFEICRSLIYSESSFLSEPSWTALMSEMRDGDPAELWHPKEELFDLMLACSALSTRVWSAVDPDDVPPQRSTLSELTASGHLIRNSLESWHANLQIRLLTTKTQSQDPWTLLASIYYHATSIYLSGLFDYRPQFDDITSPSPPSLPQSTILYHTHKIISQTQHALKTTRLAGILFFFPLRVAGARADTHQQRIAIMTMLKEISQRSFVVADAFVLDLSTLWGEERVREESHRAWD